MSIDHGRSRGAGSQAALRAANRRRVLAVLGTSGPRSQSELSRETGLSGGAVSGLVRELADLNLVKVSPGLRGGRHVIEVSLIPSDQMVLAIDAGHRHLRAALADSSGTVVAERVDVRHLTWRLDHDIPILVDLYLGLLEQAGRGRDQLAVCVIGLPVPFGSSGPGRLAREWAGAGVVEALGAALGAPVLLENDANLGALGEAREGAGAGCSDFVYLKVAHGLGAGLVLAGQLYRGGRLAAGEIGHVSVDETGALCSCGGRGCLELYASGRAIATSLADIHGGRPTLGQIIENCHEGEPSFVRAVADAGRQLGFVLANVVSLLAPSRIIIGGELSQTGSVLFDATRLGVQYGSARTLGDQVDVVGASLGDRAELTGAIALGVTELRARLDLPGAEVLVQAPAVS